MRKRSPGKIGLRQQLAGGETEVVAAGQDHFRTVILRVLGPLGLLIIVEVIIVEAEEYVMAAE